MISFALESPGFESHTDIILYLSLSSVIFFFILFLLLLRENGHYWWKSWSVITSYVIDHCHTWDKNIPFFGCQRFFCLGLLVSSKDKILSPNVHHCYMSCLMAKTTKWHVRPAKTQISLGIRPVWSESSLSAWRKLWSLGAHCTHSEDSDLSLGWAQSHFVGFDMRRLIYRCSGTTTTYILGLQLHL